jgi:hypothetical protein
MRPEKVPPSRIRAVISRDLDTFTATAPASAGTLRLTDKETALPRQQAEREGRSMHEVVRLAIQERSASQDHGDRVRLATCRMATQHDEILDRLKDA